MSPETALLRRLFLGESLRWLCPQSHSKAETFKATFALLQPYARIYHHSRAIVIYIWEFLVRRLRHTTPGKVGSPILFFTETDCIALKHNDLISFGLLQYCKVDHL